MNDPYEEARAIANLLDMAGMCEWDNKFLSNSASIPSSTTFTPGSNTLSNATTQAEQAILNSNLPPAVQQQAIQNLQNGNFTTNTVGSGAVKNSVTVKLCNGLPC